MDQEKSKATESLEADADLREAVASSSLFDRLKNGLKKVTIEGQTFYLAEGDTLLDEDQLGVYAIQREAVDAAREAARRASDAGLGLTVITDGPSDRLLGMTEGGKIVRWAPDAVLSYRVIRETFGASANYAMVVSNMRAATAAWENACGVRFEHRQELDEIPGTGKEGCVFTVRELDAGGEFIAAAFFPNDPISRRRVVIDPSYYAASLTFDRVGVLRHELGHALGFRHEHIKSGAPAVCPDEPLFNTISLSDYDPKSVMHYFCGGVGSRELALSERDIASARLVYGTAAAPIPPDQLTQFRLINPNG